MNSIIDNQKTLTQTTLGLAALLSLLEDKGVITQDEYVKEYEKAKRILIKETLKEIKAQL